MGLLDDVEHDLSAWHRVEDMWALPARRWWMFAERTPLLPGAVRAALQRAEEERQQEVPDRPAESLESLTRHRWEDGTPMFSVARVPKG